MMNGGKMWKKTALVYFKVLFQHLTGRIEENYKAPLSI
jgi:hypothetical protein